MDAVYIKKLTTNITYFSDKKRKACIILTMKQRLLTLLATSLILLNSVSASERVFRWVSLDGSMIMNGGKIVQKNYTAQNCINIKCGDEYTLMLVGKKEDINREGTENAACLELTLNDGRRFHAGDIIRITGYRYHSDSDKASIAFIFNNQAEITDNNTWADINPRYEDEEGESSEVGNESFGTGFIFNLANSYDFEVPQEADGATTLLMTRDRAEAYLYISEMEIFSDADNTTGICRKHTNMEEYKTETYSTQGVRTEDDNMRKGQIYITNGKKTIK